MTDVQGRRRYISQLKQSEWICLPPVSLFSSGSQGIGWFPLILGGQSSFLSSPIQRLISSRNTLSDMPRNVSPDIWASLNPVKLTQFFFTPSNISLTIPVKLKKKKILNTMMIFFKFWFFLLLCFSLNNIIDFILRGMKTVPISLWLVVLFFLCCPGSYSSCFSVCNDIKSYLVLVLYLGIVFIFKYFKLASYLNASKVAQW